ncbi:uncharacterized protein I206_101074 [Kwoniella pini CBS 10737]|uniref:Uncharacterized protein n=1 Tax=Kwoniella pini CBS 10737 TaxID=1296096 RepID=A0AAJ8KZ76_9TREE
MFLYNVHTPQKTFALTHKDDEDRSKLFERVLAKAGLTKEQKSQASLLYEFEGERWSLDDDDDFEILSSRFPPTSTPSATLHLTIPQQAHAHFSNPPAYNGSSGPKSSPSSKLKSKVKKSSSMKSTTTKSANGDSPSKAAEIKPLGEPINGSPVREKKQSLSVLGSDSPVGASNGDQTRSLNGAGKAKSVMSTRSRKSKWGDDDAEPLGAVRKREWEEFHNNKGSRTVMGKINGIPNIRMLLKSGYRHVYVSREFALKHKLVPKKSGMGSMGYTGLKVMSNVDITVGTRTASHPAYMSEENYFDVILGRSWLEKMAIKIDPLDPTALTYMDSGEAIPCDLVVLKDDNGNVITIT